MRIEWRGSTTKLPSAATALVAFPGVGNIGKMAVDSVCELHESVELVRLHPVGLPPHAHLDEDGLLAPPHLSIRQIQTPNGTPLITLTGKTQPTEPSQQSVLAAELMAFFQEQKVATVCRTYVYDPRQLRT